MAAAKLSLFLNKSVAGTSGDNGGGTVIVFKCKRCRFS